MTESEIELVRALAPHVHRALQLQEALLQLDLQNRALLGSLDRLDRGFFLLNALGYVLAVNKVAERLTATNDGLTLTTAGLTCHMAADTAQLHRLIAAAAHAHGSDGTLFLQRTSGRKPWIVTVTPYRLGPATQGLAAVLLSDPEADTAPDPAAVAQLFGFTPAEARLATHLARGDRVEDAAESLRITVNTARTHVQRMLSKAGVRRQAELAILLSGLPREQNQ